MCIDKLITYFYLVLESIDRPFTMNAVIIYGVRNLNSFLIHFKDYKVTVYKDLLCQSGLLQVGILIVQYLAFNILHHINK